MSSVKLFIPVFNPTYLTAYRWSRRDGAHYGFADVGVFGGGGCAGAGGEKPHVLLRSNATRAPFCLSSFLSSYHLIAIDAACRCSTSDERCPGKRR